MTKQSSTQRSGLPLMTALLVAFAGGLFMGYVDLTAGEVQGPALILMMVAFFCAIPRSAPAWAVAVAVAVGLPLMHLFAVWRGLPGYPPNFGMLIAIVPALIAAYVGKAVGVLVEATTSALWPAASASPKVDSVEAPHAMPRSLIVFGGLAACALLGLPVVRNVLWIQRGLHSTGLWDALIWQLATLVAWCAAAVVIVRHNNARYADGQTAGDITVLTVLRHTMLVVIGAAGHAAGVLLLSSLLYTPATAIKSFPFELDLPFASYVFLMYLPLDALAYMTIQLLIYSTDQERIRRAAGRRDAELTAALDQARLAALNAQLRPHFMFNALNSVVVLARRGDAERAGDAASSLADLMRYVLRDDEAAGSTTLREEMEFVRSYFDLERIRFPDRLQTAVVYDDGIADVIVPRLILQPLVENAVRHGISQRIEAGTIRVAAEQVGQELRIAVIDDGPGFDEAIASGSDSGLGLRATRTRLAAYYGGKARMEVAPMQPRGTRVTIRMPIP